MKNLEVVDYIRNNGFDNTFADEFRKEGYGQTVGGYNNGIKKGEYQKQKEHFINYYEDKELKLSNLYNRLFCPELILFVAEVFGVPHEKICEAADIVKKYENEEGIKNTEKNGTYFSSNKNIFEEFKSVLKFNEVNKCVKQAENMEDAKERIQQLFVK